MEQTIAEMLKKILRRLDNYNPDADELAPPEQAAKILGVKKQTLSLWRHKSIGPAYVKVGNSVRYKRSALTEYIERNTVNV